VIIDNKKIKDLKEEIYQGYGVEYKYHWLSYWIS
jgi:hypothetical protein